MRPGASAATAPARERGGYVAVKQQTIGTRCGGGTHKVDAIATLGDDRILVSLKWQQTGGTAEQKVPFEVMCLADAVTAGHAVRAFLVLGGDGLETPRLLHVWQAFRAPDPRSSSTRRDARSRLPSNQTIGRPTPGVATVWRRPAICPYRSARGSGARCSSWSAICVAGRTATKL